MKKTLAVLTIFLGSFLVFGVQPMVGRTILPVFGGTAAVWVVCLCAFQVLLLAGYFYAHLVGGSVDRRKIVWHSALLLVSAGITAAVALLRGRFLPLVSTGVAPVDVLLCVVLLTGFSYVLLSANASLVQSVTGGSGVYRLYAVSNFGSLFGLLAYPFVLEPHVGLTWQWMGFSLGIVIYAALLFYLGSRPTASQSSPSSPRAAPLPTSACRPSSTLLPLVLPAVSCFVLNALTTHITLDVMPMPLIWTGSLALFLISYVIGFSGGAAKIIRPAAVITMALLVAVCWIEGRPIAKVGLLTALSLNGGLLLVACTFLHGWLYLIRPTEGSSSLTRYYLFQAIGGAIGGSVASLAFPSLCNTVAEHPVALVLLGGLVFVGLMSPSIGVRARGRLPAVAQIVLSLILGAAAVYLYVAGSGIESRAHVYRARGFFGTIDVLEAKARINAGEGVIHEFVHGSTVHGIQALIPGKERMPTCYYTMNAAGYAVVGHPKYRNGDPMRVNLVGLGVGVLFAYGREGDYYRAYEISKDALDVATNTNLFTFVSDCPAEKSIVLGDARKGLEAELAAGVEPYDVIVVDAFTGDNIPFHLSTIEAFDLYFKLLKPDGVLCINISNWHLDLFPYIRALGDYYDCPILGFSTTDNYGSLQFAAKVAFFCRQPQGLATPPIGDSPLQARMIDFSRIKPMAELPTDEKGSFVSLIRW